MHIQPRSMIVHTKPSGRPDRRGRNGHQRRNSRRSPCWLLGRRGERSLRLYERSLRDPHQTSARGPHRPPRTVARGDRGLRARPVSDRVRLFKPWRLGQIPPARRKGAEQDATVGKTQWLVNNWQGTTRYRNFTIKRRGTCVCACVFVRQAGRRVGSRRPAGRRCWQWRRSGSADVLLLHSIPV
jgi:hypothetical protein